MLKKTARSGTFTDNMKLPVHRWFRYSAGFSAEWVLSEIERFQLERGDRVVLLEPFTGSGTTNIAADSIGVESFGFEGHPFVARIAKAKQLWRLKPSDFNEAAKKVMDCALSSQVKLTIPRYSEDNLLGKVLFIRSV